MSDPLLDAFTPAGPMREAVSETAWVQGMLDAEAALASAVADAGLIPLTAALEIRGACVAAHFDLDAIRAAVPATGTLAAPLVDTLRAAVSDDAAGYVHFGATSQDIQDTAAMLVLRSGLDILAGDLLAAARAAARLAGEHRHTLCVARTLLQHASPTTFGAKAAAWLDALLDANAEVRRVQRTGLAAQLGGAAGTLAGFGPQGLDIASRFAADLNLAAPSLPWHTNRSRVLASACACGLSAAACEKIAFDVGLLAQTEVGEVREAAEPGRGVSSTLPHKHNPVGVVAVRVNTRRALAEATLLLGSPSHEHERSLGSWQGEARAITDLLHAAGAAAAATRTLLDGLAVDVGRMLANLHATHGLALTDAVTGVLARSLGRVHAREVVARVVRRVEEQGSHVRDELLAEPDAQTLSAAELDAALDPAANVGVTGALVERALARLQEMEAEETA